MQKFGLCLISLSCLGLTQLCAPAIASRHQPTPTAEPASEASESVQRLAEMFSVEIQSTLNACWNQGKVDLAAGAAQSGAVTCGNGTTDNTVTYSDYVNTVSDILAASGLVGFRTVIASNPRINPQMISTFLSDPQGTAILRQTVQTAITQSQLLPAEATQSNAILTEQVMERLVPSLQNPTVLDGLLGSEEQYTQVVSNFCTAPGMSVSEAKAIVPDLSSIQLYAICIHESGVTDEALQMMQ
ncbi:hypothetical protein H6G89_18350 [Oscillatoria sp. FACHB-1407]|uniref:hypothetical protein n=1 Tax=Oscillatoria sp. FACHB-1407 TaxID=2692847 RepID=UPI00168641C0|nr:hypothetical protein [Oscillatoria sp. FACHB-1407]MBD2463005.1 hypothetical protein [Oscillatoria sp. FACHB-1407]